MVFGPGIELVRCKQASGLCFVEGHMQFESTDDFGYDPRSYLMDLFPWTGEPVRPDYNTV